MGTVYSLYSVITIKKDLNVVLCPSDVDTTIVRTALEIVNVPVTILADDTDILYLLLHHVYFCDENKDIFLKNMRTQKEAGERISYSIKYIIATLDLTFLEYMLFYHRRIETDKIIR